MQELHIQPSELDKLTDKRKWSYYYLVIFKLLKEKEEMENLINKSKGQNADIMEFPDDFISYAIDREKLKEVE